MIAPLDFQESTMLPTMQPIESLRTKRARATKSFEAVHTRRVCLYFSHFELVGFQVYGAPPVVCMPLKPVGPDTGAHVELNRLQLEPDKSKWDSKQDFESKWEDVSRSVFHLK
jgi:hypothetical protein